MDPNSLIQDIQRHIPHSSNERALYVLTEVSEEHVLQGSWGQRKHKACKPFSKLTLIRLHKPCGIESQHDPLIIQAPVGIFQSCVWENHERPRPYQRSWLNCIFARYCTFENLLSDKTKLHIDARAVGTPILRASFRQSGPHLDNVGFIYVICLQHTMQYSKSFMIIKPFNS